MPMGVFQVDESLPSYYFSSNWMSVPYLPFKRVLRNKAILWEPCKGKGVSQHPHCESKLIACSQSKAPYRYPVAIQSLLINFFLFVFFNSYSILYLTPFTLLLLFLLPFTTQKFISAPKFILGLFFFTLIYRLPRSFQAFGSIHTTSQ